MFCGAEHVTSAAAAAFFSAYCFLQHPTAGCLLAYMKGEEVEA